MAERGVAHMEVASRPYNDLVSYCKAHGLAVASPCELLVRSDLAETDRAWLTSFEVDWEKYMASEEAHAIVLRTPLELAGCFVSVLRDTISDEEFGSVVQGTVRPDEVCDANVAMATAFLRLHEKDPWLPSDAEEGRCTEEELALEMHLWNQALLLFFKHMRRQHRAG